MNLDEKIKIYWIETYDGKAFDFGQSLEYMKRCYFTTLYIDMHIATQLGNWIDVADVKKVHLYEGFVRKFNVMVTFLEHAECNMEELYLPEGVKNFQVSDPGVRSANLIIPYSLDTLCCFNDMEVIGFDECIKNGDLKNVDIINRW